MIVICFFNKIRLAIAIIEAASEFVRDVKSAFLVPIFTYLMLVVISVAWLLIAVYLYTSGKWEPHNSGLPFG